MRSLGKRKQCYINNRKRNGNNTRQKKQREKIIQSIDITLKKSYYNNMLILKQ